MAVTLINRPLGHGLGIVYNCTITDSGGDALVTMVEPPPDDYWVYIHSNIERYNGFVNITIIGPTTFKISRREDGDFIEYIQDSDIELQISLLDHSWQSAHLPIVYEIESDLYPVNVVEEEATHSTISADADSNGYTQITTTGGMVDPEALEYIQLVGNGPLAGVYQIVQGIDFFNVVIDLAYNASNDFSPYYVVKYYNNYFITVQVWAGLEAGHQWYDEKPSVLAASLRLIPDSNNQVKFSIAEIVKGFITTRNNLTLDTLPNNLDFYTQFHISYFESYDEVIDNEIVIFNGDVEDDDFIGNAVNSQMPFKSVNESFMSDYVAYPAHAARWLTLQDKPVAIVGYFFDLSFLLTQDADVNVTIFKSVGGTVTATEIIEIPNPGTGVIRVPFIPESGYDLYCIMASAPGGNEPLTMTSFANTSTGVAWTTGATPSVSLSSSQTSQILFIAYEFITDEDYTITANFNYNISAIISSLRIGVYDASNNLIDSNINSGYFSVGSDSIVLQFTGVPNAARIGIRSQQGPIPGASSFTITSASVETMGSNITEQICLDIIEECGSTFTNDNLRITENGYFRELE